MATPTIIDLFSGAGLFSEGFRSSGFRPILAADVDRRAIASYNRNVAPVGVTREVAEDMHVPRADVLLAGPPCQGFSTLGRQDPADVRNRLGLVIPELADRAAANIAIIENVPPFIASDSWQTICREFKDRGYSVQVWILDAADFGAPQLRTRAFTIASRIGAIMTPQKSSVITKAEVAFAPILDGDPMHIWPTPSKLAMARFRLIPPRGDKRDIVKAAPELCPPSWTRMGAQATDVWGRMDPSQPANTIRCRFQNPSTGRYVHPSENRTISLREAARLQGVPDTWNFEGDVTSIARQIGNGVTVPLGQAIASSVLAAMRGARLLAA